MNHNIGIAKQNRLIVVLLIVVPNKIYSEPKPSKNTHCLDFVTKISCIHTFQPAQMVASNAMQWNIRRSAHPFLFSFLNKRTAAAGNIEMARGHVLFVEHA